MLGTVKKKRRCVTIYGLVGWVWSVTTYNEKKLHLTQDKQGTSNN